MTVAEYVDTHCHIDAYDNPPEVLAAAARSGVMTVAVTELPSSYKRLRVRLGKRPLTHVAMGFHPMKALFVSSKERQVFLRELPTTDYLGEVGLDFSRNSPSREVQLDVFQWFLNQDVSQKVISMHSRGAERELIRLVAGRRLRGSILHWYSGPLSLVEQALQAGCHFSVNLPMVRSKKGRALLERLPRERVLTETDGPYARNARRESQPSDIPLLTKEIAVLWDVSPADVQDCVRSNMERLLTSTVGPASSDHVARDHPQLPGLGKQSPTFLI